MFGDNIANALFYAFRMSFPILEFNLLSILEYYIAYINYIIIKYIYKLYNIIHYNLFCNTKIVL